MIEKSKYHFQKGFSKEDYKLLKLNEDLLDLFKTSETNIDRSRFTKLLQEMKKYDRISIHFQYQESKNKTYHIRELEKELEQLEKERYNLISRAEGEVKVVEDVFGEKSVVADMDQREEYFIQSYFKGLESMDKQLEIIKAKTIQMSFPQHTLIKTIREDSVHGKTVEAFIYEQLENGSKIKLISVYRSTPYSRAKIQRSIIIATVGSIAAIIVFENSFNE